MHVVGLRTWRELQGEACIGFEQMPTTKKQIATTRTFDREIEDYEELHRRVAQYTGARAEKLRRQRKVCGEIRVFILTNRHDENRPQSYESRLVKLSVPTDDTLELTALAARMLRSIYRKGYVTNEPESFYRTCGPKRDSNATCSTRRAEQNTLG